MAFTPQDPEWHGEGDVRIHTEMVINEIYQILESRAHQIPPGERLILILGAALHDIGKVLTTKNEEIEGKDRVVSPHHAERGCSYVAPRMGALGLAQPEAIQILGLIRYHHHVRKLVSRNSQQYEYCRLARGVDLKLVYLLEQADNRGRICDDIDSQIEVLELFRLAAIEFGLWEMTDPYSAWRSFFEKEIPNPGEQEYACCWAIHDYESGFINSPEEALARTWQHRKKHSVVTVVCGPGGSGKSNWIENICGPDDKKISLDEIRKEITGKSDDQSKNGQVVQLAKERLRQALREKQNVFWDSTALRRDGRSLILNLARDYHALTRVVSFGISPHTAHTRNVSRKTPVPASVIDKQFRQYQWPAVHEAHLVDYLFDL
ncbi:MAG: AAA family ATPase [Verrucomicrobiales bacterium]|nr:AAA family ATPase [Verrucomicrobiales bacterium]